MTKRTFIMLKTLAAIYLLIAEPFLLKWVVDPELKGLIWLLAAIMVVVMAMQE